MRYRLRIDDIARHGAARREELQIPRRVARDLGLSALEAIRTGRYVHAGMTVDWSDAVADAIERKRSLPPSALLSDPLDPPVASVPELLVEVVNETTLGAARRLVDDGVRPLALNFANGIEPGGGFLDGARAQEELLCRSSALYGTLEGDATYEGAPASLASGLERLGDPLAERSRVPAGRRHGAS